MAPVKCYYLNCMNTNTSKSMFTFPIHDEPRLKLWIKHSGNANLASMTQELKHRYICEDHFKAEDIIKNVVRSRLLPTAVPLMYEPDALQCHNISPDDLKVKTPHKVYTKKCINLPPQKDASPCTSMIDAPHTKSALKRRRLFKDKEALPEVKRLNKQIAILQRKNKAQETKIRELSLKCVKKDIKSVFDSFNFSSEAAKVVAKIQLRDPTSRKKWTKSEKELCLSIYFKSPAAYIHMRRQGIVLAAPSTIRLWLGKSNCLPGLQKDIFVNVEKFFINATIQKRSCVITFDEMSIMSSLEYSKKYDHIEGFQDYGGGDKTALVAKYVLVFLIRGLYSRWKLPVAYFLSAGNVQANKLTFLVKIVINKLFDIGLLPKAVVSDQISTNQKAMKTLGVSAHSPFFFCNGRKIFALFDIPHALKNIRNNWLSSDLTDGDKVFSFSDVTTTYEIDKLNKSKCLHKLTPAHLNPNNFQKMNVSLAAQVLSRSVAVAIRTVVGTGELKSQTALDTANFIEIINNTFDALNSKKRQSKNPFNCALTKHLNRTRQALIDGKNLLCKLKKILKKKNGSTALTRPPSFDGFLQSIEAVLEMFEEESSGGIKYLLTNRLNQDALENQFSLFRLKAGFNKNPSARVLRTMFRSQLVNGLMKSSEKKNCLDDNDMYIENTIFQEAAISIADKENKNENVTSECHDCIIPSTSSQRFEQKRTETISKLTLEQCSVVYFAGYLAKKCLDKFNCKQCQETLIKRNQELNDKNQLLILNKLYPSAYAPKLLAPTEALLKLVDSSLTIFKEYFDSLKHKENLRLTLYNCIKLNYVPQENICENHEKYLIYHLLIVKIYDFCKTQKKNVLSNKVNPKLKILKNL